MFRARFYVNSICMNKLFNKTGLEEFEDLLARQDVKIKKYKCKNHEKWFEIRKKDINLVKLAAPDVLTAEDVFEQMLSRMNRNPKSIGYSKVLGEITKLYLDNRREFSFNIDSDDGDKYSFKNPEMKFLSWWQIHRFKKAFKAWKKHILRRELFTP